MSFSTDDTDLRGAHREVQDATSWGEQPDREQPARAEVGGGQSLQSYILTQEEVSGQSVWLEQRCVLRLPQVLE